VRLRGAAAPGRRKRFVRAHASVEHVDWRGLSARSVERLEQAMRVDISPAWGGYYRCVARTVYTGTPPPEVVDAYAALRETHEKGLAGIKPGVTNHEVYTRTKNELEAGMCFLFEPVVHVRGFGDLAVTDCAAITETGVEILTRSDRRLFLSE
jgi:Xaa-Pro aminopeptidase